MKLIRRDTIAEANIQAELYHQCRLMGISIYLEYKVKIPGERGCRFDAVILDGDDNIKCIIEIKARTKMSIQQLMNTNQAKRYSQFGVPVKYLTQNTDIIHFLSSEIQPLLCELV